MQISKQPRFSLQLKTTKATRAKHKWLQHSSMTFHLQLKPIKLSNRYQCPNQMHLCSSEISLPTTILHQFKNLRKLLLNNLNKLFTQCQTWSRKSQPCKMHHHLSYEWTRLNPLLVLMTSNCSRLLVFLCLLDTGHLDLCPMHKLYSLRAILVVK